MNELYEKVRKYKNNDEFIDKLAKIIEPLDATNTTKIILYSLRYCNQASDSSRNNKIYNFFILDNRCKQKIDFNCIVQDVKKELIMPVYNNTESCNILGLAIMQNISLTLITALIEQCPSDMINKEIFYTNGMKVNALECAIKFHKCFGPAMYQSFIKKGATTKKFAYFFLQNQNMNEKRLEWALANKYISFENEIDQSKFSFFLLGYAAYLKFTTNDKYKLHKESINSKFNALLNKASPQDLSCVVKTGPISDKSLLGLANYYQDQDLINYLISKPQVLDPTEWLESKLNQYNNFPLDEIQYPQEVLHDSPQLSESQSDNCIMQKSSFSSSNVHKKNKQIQMYIDQKYLNFNYPEESRLYSNTVHGNQSLHAFDEITATKLAFQQVSDFKTDGQYTHHFTDDRINYFYPRTKSSICKDDKVFVVFAGRGLNASLPSNLDNSRCLVVLSFEEYKACEISKRGTLLENYDFLILTKPRIKADGTEANAASLIERRRAALDFCNNFDLEHVIFMDDNLENICFIPPLGFEKTFAGLYDYVVNQMHSGHHMFVSIHTYSSLKRVPVDHMLGCKVWALDLATIRKYLPGAAMQLCFPDREDAWGEDYYLQVLLDVLSPESDGFRILDYTVVELTRRKTNASVCAKTGMKCKELIVSDIIPQSMFLDENTSKKIEEAIRLFNQLLEKELSRHKKNAQEVKLIDYEKFRHDQFTLAACQKKSKYHTRLFFDGKYFNHQKLHLKEYQTRAIDFYLENSGQKNITYDMPTGCGKTLIMLTIAFANFSRFQKNIILVYPRIELIKQLLHEILNSRYSFLLDYFQIRFEQIFGVSSGHIAELEHTMLRQDIVAYNQSMQEKPHILIFCEDSWRSYLKASSESNLLKTIGLIVFDESHLQKKAIQETRGVFPEISIHYYSATPNIHKNEILFSFTRDEAIRQKHLAPIYVDSSLPNQFNVENLVQVLSNQEHPNDEMLHQHKGIIFVDNCNNAQMLAAKLHLVLPELHVFQIHSNCKDCSKNIQEFSAKKSAAVAIAVDMLQEGYNDEELDFVIYAKTNQVTDILKQNLIQAAGRLHRTSSDKPNKIGFLIVNFEYTGIVTSYLPRMMRIIPSVKATLGLYTPLQGVNKRLI